MTESSMKISKHGKFYKLENGKHWSATKWWLPRKDMWRMSMITGKDDFSLQLHMGCSSMPQLDVFFSFSVSIKFQPKAKYYQLQPQGIIVYLEQKFLNILIIWHLCYSTHIPLHSPDLFPYFLENFYFIHGNSLVVLFWRRHSYNLIYLLLLKVRHSKLTSIFVTSW